jgi:hypothetical protein
MVFEYYPQNIHCRSTTIIDDGSIWPAIWGNDIVYAYTHGPSMFDPLDLATITFQKVKEFAHKKNTY